jgi:hypothetical protein
MISDDMWQAHRVLPMIREYSGYVKPVCGSGLKLHPTQIPWHPPHKTHGRSFKHQSKLFFAWLVDITRHTISGCRPWPHELPAGKSWGLLDGIN